ncbi:MAG: 2-oxoacid:ferredoxin oxidoreductase subunit beta, partial [Frankia sp.]
FQNCNIFNDGAFDQLKDRTTREDHTLRLNHGEPLVFGVDSDKAIVRSADGGLAVGAATDPAVVVHDAKATDPTHAFALSRLTGDSAGVTPIGVFRDIDVPAYDELVNKQVNEATERLGEGDLMALLNSGDTWSVG